MPLVASNIDVAVVELAVLSMLCENTQECREMHEAEGLALPVVEEQHDGLQVVPEHESSQLVPLELHLVVRAETLNFDKVMRRNVVRRVPNERMQSLDLDRRTVESVSGISATIHCFEYAFGFITHAFEACSEGLFMECH